MKILQPGISANSRVSKAVGSYSAGARGKQCYLCGWEGALRTSGKKEKEEG